MGLAISIIIALPAGAVVGCCLGPCATKAFEASPLKRQCCSFRTLLFPSLLAIGVLGLFVPLFVLCARYDGVRVSTALTEGACWSTGGQMPYTGLGFAAGIITGTGFTGCVWLLIALLRSRAADKDQSLQVVDVEQGSEAIVNDSDGEQDSNNNNTTITVS